MSHEDKKNKNSTEVAKDIYLKLSKEIPEKYLVTYVEDGKTFKGYHAQYAIDLLNEVIGLGKWEVDSWIVKEEIVNKGWAIAMETTIIIHINDHVIKVTGSGGAHAKNIANAYKGARTSAFKNACRYLGIGKELYIQGDIDDDIITQVEVEKVQIPESITDLVKKIDNTKNIEELRQLEDEVKAIKDKTDQNIVFKKYNDRKIFFMTTKK